MSWILRYTSDSAIAIHAAMQLETPSLRILIPPARRGTGRTGRQGQPRCQLDMTSHPSTETLRIARCGCTQQQPRDSSFAHPEPSAVALADGWWMNTGGVYSGRKRGKRGRHHDLEMGAPTRHGKHMLGLANILTARTKQTASELSCSRSMF